MSNPTVFYRAPAEIWDAKKCAKLAKAIQRDGLGTPYPFKGYVGNMIQSTIRYNGGTIIDGELYPGVARVLPILAPGYMLVTVPTWGLRLIAIDQQAKDD